MQTTTQVIEQQNSNYKIVLATFNKSEGIIEGKLVNLKEPAKSPVSFTFDSLHNGNQTSNHPVLSRQSLNEFFVKSIIQESENKNVIICFSTDEDLRIIKSLLTSLNHVKVCDLRCVLLDYCEELQTFISLSNCFCGDEIKGFLSTIPGLVLTTMHSSFMKRITLPIIQQSTVLHLKPRKTATKRTHSAAIPQLTIEDIKNERENDAPRTPEQKKRRIECPQAPMKLSHNFNARVFSKEFSSTSRQLFQTSSATPSFDCKNNVFQFTTLQSEANNSKENELPRLKEHPRLKYTWKRLNGQQNSNKADQEFFENMKKKLN